MSTDDFIVRLRICLLLIEKYFDRLKERISEGEMHSFVSEGNAFIRLITRRQRSMNSQKEATLIVGATVNTMNDLCVKIRKIVRGSTRKGDEIRNAFTVDTTLENSMISKVQISGLIVEAYDKYKEWANSRGIIDQDINVLREGLNTVEESKMKQEEKKLARRLETAEKNTMQVALEKELSHISNMGKLVFEKDDPRIAKLFADLTRIKQVPDSMKDQVNDQFPESNNDSNDNNSDSDNKDTDNPTDEEKV